MIELFYKNNERLKAVNYFRKKKKSIVTFRSQMFFKIVYLKNFANFTAKHLYWSLFLIKWQVWWPATFIKRDSNKLVFLWNLRSFLEGLFLQNTSVDCFWPSQLFGLIQKSRNANCWNTIVLWIFKKLKKFVFCW